jgi:hypothetical protein
MIASLITQISKAYKVSMYSTLQTERKCSMRWRASGDWPISRIGSLQALPVEQRQNVLAEWRVRCAAGTVRDAAACLFGLIRKVLNGAFRLWAARKIAVCANDPEKATGNAQTAIDIQNVRDKSSRQTR